MTQRYVGGVYTALHSPHVYFIVCGGLLYVGETQRHPVVRWCAHLAENGSFRLAAGRDDEALALDEVGFFAYRLDQLPRLFPVVQIKQATQAIEHELHGLLRARPSYFGGRLRLISDTEKTAPRSFRNWDLARSIAEDVASAAATEIARLTA